MADGNQQRQTGTGGNPAPPAGQSHWKPDEKGANFPCKSCGGSLQFEPGSNALKCPYCGTMNEIIHDVGDVKETVREQDLLEALGEMGKQADLATTDQLTAKCSACGAEAKFDDNITSGKCPFCGTPQVMTKYSRKIIRPSALLPFAINAAQGRTLFLQWLGSRWFAPSDLAKSATVDDALQGWYVPYWTYDAKTDTDYTGWRGDDYYVTVTQTVYVNGKPELRSVQERRTRWSFASGRVDNTFDDVLVGGSTSLPVAHLQRLGGWDLGELKPYRDEYLAGLHAESYTVDLQTGFATAKGIMLDGVRRTIRQDIGGDHQRIESMNPRFYAMTYKHLLLPIWLAAYHYQGKSYRFLINGRTGTVSGDRPYSASKITLLVIGILIAIGVIVLIIALRQHR